MKTNDYLNMMLNMMGISEENYEGNYFIMPQMIAKDGFAISVQCSSGHYCGSENGYRKFGGNWKMVEWGYPSQPIDHNIFGGVCANDAETMNACDSVEIEEIDKLLDSHGGLDIITTLSNSYETMKSNFRLFASKSSKF